MGIVGTVDSGYKAERAVIRGVDGVARAVAARMALESGAVVVLGALAPSAGVRGPAPDAPAAGNASVQRGRWCGAMIDERHEAQARAAAYASVGGGGALEAREERLDGERFGFRHGRLTERGARPVEPRAGAAPVEAVAADRLQPRLGQVGEVAGEEGLRGQPHHHRIA